MLFNAQAIFANLAEKERIKGHHSPEGRTIRTLSRALSGWSSGSLAQRDVLAMCDQAMGDWLNARLNRSPWSMQSVAALLPAAVAAHWITPADAERLMDLRALHAQNAQPDEISAEAVEAALEFCIELIDKHW